MLLVLFYLFLWKTSRRVFTWLPLDRDGKVTFFVFPRWFHVYVFLLYRTALLVYPLLCLEFFLPIATWILPLGTYCGTVNAGIHRMELVLLHVSNPIVYGSSFSQVLFELRGLIWVTVLKS